MKLFKWFIIVRVLIPMHELVYRDVKTYRTNDSGTVYILTLKDGSYVRVPTAFTIIEEK